MNTAHRAASRAKRKTYPACDDAERRMVFLWRGFTVKTITHEHFGPESVEVFAIKVGA